MRPFLAFSFVVLPALLLAQSADDESINTLVRRLGSQTFTERQRASRALLDRPEAAPALRKALRSSDPEVAKRAAEILDYFDRRPVHDLNAAIVDGTVDRAIELLAAWPTGKHEDAAWEAVREVARKLFDLHEKQGGARIDPTWLQMAEPPVVIGGRRIIEPPNLPNFRFFFVRAPDVEFTRAAANASWRENSCTGAAIITSGPIRSLAVPLRHDANVAIFAGGNVEYDGPNFNLLIFSCGDVKLKYELNNSLVIARGNVVCNGVFLRDSRIIAGKSVAYTKKMMCDCTIVENEPYPLGYIRWSETKKEKAAPKSK